MLCSVVALQILRNQNFQLSLGFHFFKWKEKVADGGLKKWPTKMISTVLIFNSSLGSKKFVGKTEAWFFLLSLRQMFQFSSQFTFFCCQRWNTLVEFLFTLRRCLQKISLPYVLKPCLSCLVRVRQWRCWCWCWCFWAASRRNWCFWRSNETESFNWFDIFQKLEFVHLEDFFSSWRISVGKKNRDCVECDGSESSATEKSAQHTHCLYTHSHSLVLSLSLSLSLPLSSLIAQK